MSYDTTNLTAAAMGAGGFEYISDDSYIAKTFIAFKAVNGDVNATFDVDCGNGVVKSFTKDVKETENFILGNINNLQKNSGAGEIFAYYKLGEAE